MALKDWSTTAESNRSVGSINWAEGQAPSTVNNSAIAEMADVRMFYETLDWRDWGLTITYLTSTSFKVTGDYTAVYHTGRRIRAVGSTTGTIYGSITTGTESGGETTVVCAWDSGTLQNETLAISVGISSTGSPVLNFPSGTRMFFQQSSAPTGWTTSATYGDRAIRVVKDGFYTTPAVFSDGFAVVFGTSKVTGSSTVSTPAHTHFVATSIAGGSNISSSTYMSRRESGSGDLDYSLQGNANVADVGLTSEAGGGDGSHTHTRPSMDLSYLDAVIGVKD